VIYLKNFLVIFHSIVDIALINEESYFQSNHSYIRYDFDTKGFHIKMFYDYFIEFWMLIADRIEELLQKDGVIIV